MSEQHPSSSAARIAPIIVLATSARALVCSARRGGFRVQGVDGFGDADTRAGAQRLLTVPLAADGPDRNAMLAATAQLLAGTPAAGLVYGSGLEGNAGIVEQLARLLPVFGNTAAALAASRNPLELAACCAAMGASYAQTSNTAPPDPRNWLLKDQAGCGGTAVHRASGQTQTGPGQYYQRYQAGTQISALFLADGQHARVLGIHEQWCADPAVVGMPFMHGGAVSRHDLRINLGGPIQRLAQGLTKAFGLCGLNGIDCIRRGEELVLIELNPRPCASIDLYDHEHAGGLFRQHLQSVQGYLTAASPAAGYALSTRAVRAPADAARETRGYQIVYAPAPVRIPPAVPWPAWSTDRPMAGTSIAGGMPLCTVHAGGKEPARVRGLLRQRQQHMLGMLNPIRTGHQPVTAGNATGTEEPTPCSRGGATDNPLQGVTQ